MNYNPCSLYLIIKPNSNFSQTNCCYCKIGIAGDVDQRFYALDCHPEPLELIAEYEATDREEATKLEAIIHNILQKKRVRGEWFNLNQSDLKVLDELIVSIFELNPTYEAKHYLTNDLNEWKYFEVNDL